VVTPAGSNQVQEYNAQQKEFKPALHAGLPQRINFLPLPGNLGFIPSTRARSGDDEKALEVLVLAESTPAGTVQEVIPIATILLDMAGEIKYMVVAVPARPSLRYLDATDLTSFTRDFPATRQMVHAWFYIICLTNRCASPVGKMKNLPKCSSGNKCCKYNGRLYKQTTTVITRVVNKIVEE